MTLSCTKERGGEGEKKLALSFKKQKKNKINNRVSSSAAAATEEVFLIDILFGVVLCFAQGRPRLEPGLSLLLLLLLFSFFDGRAGSFIMSESSLRWPSADKSHFPSVLLTSCVYNEHDDEF